MTTIRSKINPNIRPPTCSGYQPRIWKIATYDESVELKDIYCEHWQLKEAVDHLIHDGEDPEPRVYCFNLRDLSSDGELALYFSDEHASPAWPVRQVLLLRSTGQVADHMELTLRHHYLQDLKEFLRNNRFYSTGKGS